MEVKTRVLLHENYIYRETYEYYVDDIPDNWSEMTTDAKVEWLSNETDCTLHSKYPLQPAADPNYEIEIDEGDND